MSEIAFPDFTTRFKLRLRDYVNPVERRIKEVEKKLYALDIFDPEKFILPVCILSFIFSIFLALLLFLSWQYIVESGGLLQYPIVYTLAALPWEVKTVLKLGACLFLGIFAYPWLAVAFFNLVIRFKASEKREKIDRNLYSALCVLSGLGKGGVPIQQAIEEIVKSEFEGVREEFAKILTAVRYAGIELREAMLTVAMTTVSDKLSIFLRGLVNYIEKRRDYSDYVAEFLAIDNLNRRIELESYSTKLKNLSALFIALLAILPTMGIFNITSSFLEAGGGDAAMFMIYVGLPLTAVAMLAVFYMGSPEKRMRRRMAKEAMSAAFLIGFTVLTSVYLERFLEIDGVVRLAVLAATLAATALLIFFSRILRKEKKLEGELDSFLMDLIAASKSGSQLFTASGEIGKELAPAIAEGYVSSYGEALKQHSKKVAHPFLSLVLYTLGCVIHTTKNLSDVLLGIVYEYHRFFEMSKLRASVAKTAGMFAIASFFIIAFTMLIIKIQLVPMFESFAKMSSTRIDLAAVKSIPDDSVVILASVLPLANGAVLSDYRKCFGTFILTLSVAFAFIAL